MADIGTHWLDLVHAITGLEAEAVCADLLTVHPVRRRPRGEVETFGGKLAKEDELEPVSITTEDYGAIAVEDRLASVTHPVLVLAGRHDRTCPVSAAEAMAAALPDSELVVFEHSGHMTFVEENEAYLAAVRGFLERRIA